MKKNFKEILNTILMIIVVGVLVYFLIHYGFSIFACLYVISHNIYDIVGFPKVVVVELLGWGIVGFIIFGALLYEMIKSIIKYYKTKRNE